MTRSWKLVFGLFCALVLIASAALRVLEKVPITTHEAPSAEAQRNRFLAAQRMLTAIDVPWQEIRGLPTELPAGPGSTVIWPFNRGVLPRHALDAVERYVESGGHLIVEAGWWKDDPMLERFGIYRPELSSDDEAKSEREVDNDEESDRDWKDEDEFETTEIKSEENCECADKPDYSGYIRGGELLGEPEIWLEIRSGSRLASTQSVIGTIGHSEASRLVHFARGAGRVTAIVNFNFFSNLGLGDADNAEALVRVIQLPAKAQHVLFVRPQPDSLARWLGEYAWRVIAVAALLLILLLWSTLPRFGPIESDPAPQRRRLLDHLLASGRLLWNNQQQAVLATAAAQAALDQVRREYPHTRWLSPADLAVFLRHRFDLDSGVVTLLLSPTQVRHPASMTTLVRCCAQIHNQLAPRRAERANNPLYDAYI